MPGYEEDEFEQMSSSDDEKTQQPAQKKPSAAAGESPTSMSAFATSLTGGSQALNATAATANFNFEALDSRQVSPTVSNTYGHSPVNAATGGAATTNVSLAPLAKGGSSGFVAPIPAMDSAEEAIAKVLEGKIWRKQYDSNTKKYYYYHRLTHQTTWDLAKELGFGPDGSRSNSAIQSTTPASGAKNNTAKNEGNGDGVKKQSITSTTASDNSSSLPPDPLLSRGGPNFRYSGFVGGAGFGGGGGGESESSQQSFGVQGGGGGRVFSPNGPFAGGSGGGDGNTRSGTRVGGSAFGFDAGSRTTSGGAFGELEGYVAFGGNSGTPSASTTPTPSPARQQAGAELQKSEQSEGKAGTTFISTYSSTVGGDAGSSSNPLLNATAPAIGNEREVDEEKKASSSSLSADVPNANKSSDPKEEPNNTNNISSKALPSDDASSAFSTFSGAAARIAEEAKAKQAAQLEAEKKKLAAERAQQAEAVAKLSPAPMPMLANTTRGRAGAVTLDTAGLGGSSGVFASPTSVPTPMPFGVASPSPFGATLTAVGAAATGGLVGATMPSGAVSGNFGALPLNQPQQQQQQRGVHGGVQGGLNPSSPLAFNSNTFNSIASPMLNLSQQGVGFQSVVGLHHPVPVHPAAASYPQQQYGSTPVTATSGGATTGEKLELLQTAEALERLVKAFVVLKKGDSAAPSLQQSPAERLNSHHEASDYEALLRAAHYKRTAEGAASLAAYGSSSNESYRTVIPTRGRYLADTVPFSSKGRLGEIAVNGRVPADYRDTSVSTADFVHRQQLKASEADNTDLLENEILDTIVAMMTADEGRSMWLHAGDAARHQASSNASNQRKALAKPANTYEPSVKKEAVVDVVSIDHYRAYTYEGERRNMRGSGGGPTERSGPLSNTGMAGGLGGLGARANTASASRFHVDAFDTLTGAFVPGADTPLHPTTSMEPSPLGNLLEENLEKYLLKHVVPVRGRGVLPPSAMLPDEQVMPVLTPHVARMILLDLLRICIDIVVSRFSMNSKSTLPLNGRDPIVIVYEGPLSTSNRNATRTNDSYNNNNNNHSSLPSNKVKAADDDTQTQFSPARFLTEACKRTVQSLPFELLSVEESSFLSGDRGGAAAGSARQRPRFRLEHWVTKPHLFSMIHALQWTMRKLERRTNDPYADFFDSGLDGGLGADGLPLRNAPNNYSNKSQRDNEVNVADLEGGEWSRVYASEMPFFSLAPSLSLGNRSNRGKARNSNSNSEGLVDDPLIVDEEDDDENRYNRDYASSAQTERELALVLQGQVPYGRTVGAAAPSTKKGQKSRKGFEDRMETKASTLPSSLFANGRDYFGLDEDHLEVMAYSASSIGLDVFRAIASKNKETEEADTDGGGERGLATKNPPDAASTAGAPTTSSSKDVAALKKSAPELPLAVRQEIALQCSVACIEELLQDTRILESIKRRATNKANGIIEERNKKWVERWEQGQKALKSGADFLELESKRRREEVAAAEGRIGIMVERMKAEINRQL